jgi:DNA-binding response OmpR family regulator
VADPRRVLLVEDEPRIAAFLEKGLRREGYEVVCSGDGDVGLYLATAERFDAVVLDLGLPGLHGADVLAALRAEHPDLPVVVLTARDEPAVRDAVLAAGATAYVTKPLVFADLRDLLQDLLGGGAGRG